MSVCLTGRTTSHGRADVDEGREEGGRIATQGLDEGLHDARRVACLGSKWQGMDEGMR